MSRAAHAWIVTVGDELLRGEIVDSNKSLLSDRLLELDLETVRHVTVPDEPEAISEVLGEAARRARVVLVSGGLGPTRDDITTEVAARTFGRKLVRDREVLEGIRAFFRSVGREMAENNAKQADFPEGARVLPNPLGTAPGFMLEAEGSSLFFMPGVPRELVRMVDEQVLPRLRERLSPGRVVRATLLRTFGMGESTLDRELRDFACADPDLSLGFRTQFPDNLVRVVARGASEAEASERLREAAAEIRRRLGPIVLGEGERGLAEIVAELLRTQGRTVATAESCTGGRLAGALTDVPGSSAYFLGGVVAYSDAAKIRDVGVPSDVIARHGAVSEEVAELLASRVRERHGADFGLATTGVAGPGGATGEKPVGTVVIGLVDAGGAAVRRYQLMRDRERNRTLAVHVALDWLRRRLTGLEIPDTTFPRVAGPGRGGR